MQYLADVIILIIALFLFMSLVIVTVEYDKSKKWNDIYKKKGRDDE